MSSPADSIDVDRVEIEAWHLAALAEILDEHVQNMSGRVNSDAIDAFGRLDALTDVIRRHALTLARGIDNLPRR